MQRLGVILLYFIFCSGCTLSTDTVVPESEATFDPQLLGGWKGVADGDRAVVSRAGANGYSIEYVDRDGKTGSFEARLGRLGDRRVLDVWPAASGKEPATPDGGLMVPGHLLLALTVNANEVSVATLERDSLLALLDKGEVPLPYTRYGEQVILHGATGQLRAALTNYLSRAGALSKPDIWRRTEVPTAAAEPPPKVSEACFEASPWREADLLFRRDTHWVGSDGAFSIDLGNSRTLWLFGDTWIDSSGRHTRKGASMVGNSVAIQAGSDPTTAQVAFYWGKASGDRPGAFFQGQGDHWFWPGHGIRLGGRLVLFLNRVRRTSSGLGFESVGWNAIMVDNPDDEPSTWRVTSLDTPTNPLGIIVGFAGVLRHGEYVYAFGSSDPVKSHPIYVARWTVDQIQRGNLKTPEWWAGSGTGWVPESSSAPRWPMFENGQSELTIHF